MRDLSGVEFFGGSEIEGRVFGFEAYAIGVLFVGKGGGCGTIVIGEIVLNFGECSLPEMV